MTQWEEKGRELGDRIKDLQDADLIRSLCQDLLNEILAEYDKFVSRKKPLSAVRSALIDKLEPKSLAFDIAFNIIAPKNAKELNPRTDPKTEIKPTTNKPNWSIENMKIEQLKLQPETQEIVQSALEQTGMNLKDFIQKACETYAKTVTGKVRKHGGDLANVSTSELLEKRGKYSTHPGRAEEVIKRAIYAIKKYNNEIATEPNQRWIITQSLLTELTGSRASSVKETMQKYQGDIDTHHQKYPDFFAEDGTLKAYFNRKKTKITEVIDLAELVPSGIDE